MVTRTTTKNNVGEGGSPLPTLTVHCTVSSCHYWKEDNKCDASEILITSDSFARTQPDNVDAAQASTLNATPVDRCTETVCKTFVPKDASQETLRLDNVTRQ